MQNRENEEFSVKIALWTLLVTSRSKGISMPLQTKWRKTKPKDT
jgi:hypothetical protein